MYMTPKQQKLNRQHNNQPTNLPVKNTRALVARPAGGGCGPPYLKQSIQQGQIGGSALSCWQTTLRQTGQRK